jgi:two-component system, OmpR family, sensor histidine kinase KdpD
VFSAETAVIFVPEEGPARVHPFSLFEPDAKELAVAQWVRANGAAAGKGTDTLPAAKATYFPLQTKEKTIGAVGLLLPPETQLNFEQRNFAHALVGQINAGIEREQLHDSRSRLEILEQADKLYRSLFDSVSHELKTPLTIIKGAASALVGKADQQADADYVRDLSRQVEGETERLLEVVDNMLDMTRIESGALRPTFQVVDTADLLGPALSKCGNSARIQTEVKAPVPPIQCDPTLTVQALVNVLKNALTYSKDSAVNVSVASEKEGTVKFQIRDHGPGLPKDKPERVFDRFYREKPERVGGVGLGLSIARGFIEAQGGSVTASNAPGGGAVFSIQLRAAKT